MHGKPWKRVVWTGLMQLLFTHFVGVNWICRTSLWCLVQTEVVSQRGREQWRIRTSDPSSKQSWPAAYSAHDVYGEEIFQATSHSSLSPGMGLSSNINIIIYKLKLCNFSVLLVRLPEWRIWELQDVVMTCRSGPTLRRCSCLRCLVMWSTCVLSEHWRPNHTPSPHDPGRPGTVLTKRLSAGILIYKWLLIYKCDLLMCLQEDRVHWRAGRCGLQYCGEHQGWWGHENFASS